VFGEFRLGDAQDARDAMQNLARFLELRHSSFAGDGFDAAHTGRDAAFGNDLKDANVAGAGDVGASAKLLAEIGDGDDANSSPYFRRTKPSRRWRWPDRSA